MIRFSEFRTLLKKKYPYMFYLRQSDTYNLNPIRTLYPFFETFLNHRQKKYAVGSVLDYLDWDDCVKF